MDFALNQSGLEGENVVVRSTGFMGVQILQNNKKLKPEKGTYKVNNNTGQVMEIKLQGRWVDPVPKVTIDGTPVTLAAPLKWYETAWLALPILLIINGGFIGALLGCYAIYFNGNIFCKKKTLVAKYGLTGLVSLATALLYFIVAITILYIQNKQA